MQTRSSTALHASSHLVPLLRGAFAFVVIVAGMLLCAFLVAKGSPTRIVAATAIVLLPAVAYAGLRRPILFPYALYVLLIPFDNLLLISSVGTLTKLLGMLSGLALLFWCMRIKRLQLPPRPLYVLLALLSWAFLSTLWATSQRDALVALPQYVNLALLYAVTAVTPLTLLEFRLLLAATVVGGIAASIYGTHQFYSNPLGVAGDILASRLVIQAGHSTIDPNQFANALLFPIAILTIFALRTRWLAFKALGLGGIALMVGAVALSGSRETIVGVGAIVLYYFWRTRYRVEMAIVTGCGLAASLAVQSSVWLRFANAISSGGGGRVAIWSVGFEAFKHNFLVGYGMGNFTTVYNEFYLRVRQNYPYGWWGPPHNLIVQVGVELGVVGLALLAWFLASVFRDLKVIGPDDPLYEDRVMMEASLISLFIVSMFIGLFTYKYAWLVFAMAAQLRLLVTQRAGIRRISPGESRRIAT